ncbi:hypothetical protein [Macrococcus bovicus]|uniref:hypothetical protein n=1 Tax=Macrococcus bovicus TaxID=69968 RepID=UPI0025A505B3|nr:hypothetical protein [Macrococcus bovicus]WJP97098.1 hypothetical protein QSV55_07375 [Macrococcus bovicus]
MVDKYQAQFLKRKIELLNNLINSLYRDVVESDHSTTQKQNVSDLCNIYSLATNLEFFLAANEDFQRKEFEDLIEYAFHVHHEFSAVILEDDRNTSWLYSRYNQFNDVYKDAIDSISSVI